MTLNVLKGRQKDVNLYLLGYALSNTPSLVVDCANCANPHAFASEAELSGVFIVQAEVIYKFRDTLKWLCLNGSFSCIVITTFDRLFSYGDDAEDTELFVHAWELIKELSANADVWVGVPEGFHASLAGRFCEVKDWATLHGVSA